MEEYSVSNGFVPQVRIGLGIYYYSSLQQLAVITKGTAIDRKAKRLLRAPSC